MLSSTIDNLIDILKPRQQEVLRGRFGLSGERQTLASLGENYDITRERTRQIETDGLKALAEGFNKTKDIKKSLDLINKYLGDLGGARKDDIFLQELKNLLEDKSMKVGHLQLLSKSLGQPLYYPEDHHYHYFWYLGKNHLKVLGRFIDNLERLISNRKEDLINNRNFD